MDLESVVLDVLRANEGQPMSATEIREAVRTAGHPVSQQAVQRACRSLVSDGRIGFVRGGMVRRYAVPPKRRSEPEAYAERVPAWLTDSGSDSPPRPRTATRRFWTGIATTDGSETLPGRPGWKRPSNREFERNRTEKYWGWYTLALALLIVYDMVTTAAATAIYGTEAEINPVMVWLLERGPVMFVGINLLAFLGVVLAFWLLIKVIGRAAHPYDIIMEVAVETWIGLLLLAGFVVAANNTSVILFGQSIL